jgi:hypothetical protein
MKQFILTLVFVFTASAHADIPQSIGLKGELSSEVSNLNSSVEGALQLKKSKDREARYLGTLSFKSETQDSESVDVELKVKLKDGTQKFSLRLKDRIVRFEFTREASRLVPASGETVRAQGHALVLRRIPGKEPDYEWVKLGSVTTRFVLNY